MRDLSRIHMHTLRDPTHTKCLFGKRKQSDCPPPKYQPRLRFHKATSTVVSDARTYAMNTQIFRAATLAASLALLSAHALAEEYFIAPTDGIMCTIRDGATTGTHEAIGTDMSSEARIFMEIIQVGGSAPKSFTFSADRTDLAQGWSPEGGYDVFRRNCVPILAIIPNELKQMFTNVFSTKNTKAPVE